MRPAPSEIVAPPMPVTRLREPLPAPGSLGGGAGRWRANVAPLNPYMFPPPLLTWQAPRRPLREWERP